MTNDLKQRLKKLKERWQASRLGVSEKRVCTYRPFSEKLRHKVLEAAIFTASLIPSVQAFAMPNPSKDEVRTEVINTTENTTLSETAAQRAEVAGKALWGKINRHIDVLQKEITQAKRRGTRSKQQVVRTLFRNVCPHINISGASNYCVAGALYVHQQCRDDILDQILPSAKDAHFSAGNPLTSCPASMSWFKQKLGSNYASSKSRSFNQAFHNLKPGDIIFIRSTRNTTSGLHCLTVSQRPKGNKVSVRGFNTETNYTVSKNEIAAAALIMSEYEKRWQLSFIAEQMKDLEPAHSEKNMVAPDPNTVKVTQSQKQAQIMPSDLPLQLVLSGNVQEARTPTSAQVNQATVRKKSYTQPAQPQESDVDLPASLKAHVREEDQTSAALPAILLQRTRN